MKAFYGSRISGHMIRTPEGYLVCKDVPIARTGTQQYRGAEFGGPDAERAYTVKRPEDEVFTKAALRDHLLDANGHWQLYRMPCFYESLRFKFPFHI